MGVTLIGLMVALYASSSAILLGGFAQVEEQDTQENVRRALDALSEDLVMLGTTTGDYAAWDDTYAFIGDANEDYITANLVDSTFTTLKLNLMLFVHSSGQTVFGKAFDLQDEKEIPVSPAWQNHLSAASPLLRLPDAESSQAGIMLLPEGPLLVAARPILTSERKGPIRGALIMGRYLDTAYIERLAKLTHLSITAWRFDDKQMPLDSRAASASLSEKTPILVRPLSADSIAGYTWLNDIYGKPALLLRVDTPRAIYQQGQATVRYLHGSLLVVGLVFGVVSLLLLEKSVLSRLAHLSARVRHIGARGDLSARVTMTGQDELSSLAGAINRMLETLERSQHELRESEVKHRLLLTSIRSPILALREDMTILYCNEAYAEFVGKPTTVLEGRNLLTLFPQFKKTRSYSAYLETLETGQPREVEGELGGRSIHTWVYRTPWGILAIADDITERKRAEEQVKRLNENLERRARQLVALNSASRTMVSDLNSESVLKLVIDQVRRLLDVEGAAVLLRDPAGDELVFAAAAGSGYEKLVGMRLPIAASIAGWVMRERQSAVVADTQSDPRFYDRIDPATGLTTRSLVTVPLMFKGAAWGVVEAINKIGGAFDEHDCEMLETLASSAAIAIENARLYQGERGALRRLQQSQARLVQAEKMTALGRLVASIAHEINNPLQAVQNALELAGEELAGRQRREKLERYLGIAGNEIERLTAIVRRMRDFYRPAREELQPTDPSAVLQSVLDLTGKQLQHSHVTVEREWATDLPLIHANPDYLKQVFLNLVINAVDAMSPQGGTLHVRTARDQMQLGDDRLVPAVRIEFRDTGVGMAPEVMSHLFEPFFTTKTGGTGLGLSISYEIIQAHNGQITATSQVGLGTTFTLLLPLSGV